MTRNPPLYRAVLVSLLLTGCVTQQATNDVTTPRVFPKATTQTEKPLATATVDKQPLKAEAAKRTYADAPRVTQWQLSGALAARNAKRAWSANVNWVQQGPSRYQIRLIGPLGGGTLLIERHGGDVTLRDGKKVFQSHNADALLAQQTGVRLPVSNLYYWVRGIPAPGGVQSEQRDNQHRLQILQQAGYRITYTDYMTQDAKSLPRKIQLSGNGVTLKLVIQHW